MTQETAQELEYGIWQDQIDVPRERYTCGFCGASVGSKTGFVSDYSGGSYHAWISICPMCSGPTLFGPGDKRYPGALPGGSVEHVPTSLAVLYREARICSREGAYTAAVMVCRKMLMHIAVEKGAKERLNFYRYVVWLADNNYVPPDGKDWVDYVRTRGNDANHEIALMEQEDAEALVRFVEMLLRFVYEFPQLVPPKSEPEGA